MLQIRANVFETNSSSTHTLNISKRPVDDMPAHIDFHLGEFGWGFDDANFADYLYTAIMDLDSEFNEERHEKAKERLNKIRNLLGKYGITYTFEKPRDNVWFYIDHSETLEREGTLDKILDDEDLLTRALMRPESVIHMGNDNSETEVGCENEDDFDVFDKWN